MRVPHIAPWPRRGWWSARAKTRVIWPSIGVAETARCCPRLARPETARCCPRLGLPITGVPGSGPGGRLAPTSTGPVCGRPRRSEVGFRCRSWHRSWAIGGVADNGFDDGSASAWWAVGWKRNRRADSPETALLTRTTDDGLSGAHGSASASGTVAEESAMVAARWARSPIMLNTVGRPTTRGRAADRSRRGRSEPRHFACTSTVRPTRRGVLRPRCRVEMSPLLGP